MEVEKLQTRAVTGLDEKSSTSSTTTKAVRSSSADLGTSTLSNLGGSLPLPNRQHHGMGPPPPALSYSLPQHPQHHLPSQLLTSSGGHARPMYASQYCSTNPPQHHHTNSATPPRHSPLLDFGRQSGTVGHHQQQLQRYPAHPHPYSHVYPHQQTPNNNYHSRPSTTGRFFVPRPATLPPPPPTNHHQHVTTPPAPCQQQASSFISYLPSQFPPPPFPHPSLASVVPSSHHYHPQFHNVPQKQQSHPPPTYYQQRLPHSYDVSKDNSSTSNHTNTMIAANHNHPSSDSTCLMMQSSQLMETSSYSKVSSAGCTCKRSRCLKLYCQCFAASTTCGPKCKCDYCHNSIRHADYIASARKGILQRNASAFDSKIVCTTTTTTTCTPLTPLTASSVPASPAEETEIELEPPILSHTTQTIQQLENSSTNGVSPQCPATTGLLPVRHCIRATSPPPVRPTSALSSTPPSAQSPLSASTAIRSTDEIATAICASSEPNHNSNPSSSEHSNSTNNENKILCVDNPNGIHNDICPSKNYAMIMPSPPTGMGAPISHYALNSPPHLKVSSSYSQHVQGLPTETSSRRPSMIKSQIQNQHQYIQAQNPQHLHHQQQIRISRQGCKCRRSFCLKKYCDCFQNNTMCGIHCRCVDCKNNASAVAATRTTRSSEPPSSASWYMLPNNTIKTALFPGDALHHHQQSGIGKPPPQVPFNPFGMSVPGLMYRQHPTNQNPPPTYDNTKWKVLDQLEQPQPLLSLACADGVLQSNSNNEEDHKSIDNQLRRQENVSDQPNQKIVSPVDPDNCGLRQLLNANENENDDGDGSFFEEKKEDGREPLTGSDGYTRSKIFTNSTFNAQHDIPSTVENSNPITTTATGNDQDRMAIMAAVAMTELLNGYRENNSDDSRSLNAVDNLTTRLGGAYGNIESIPSLNSLEIVSVRVEREKALTMQDHLDESRDNIRNLDTPMSTRTAAVTPEKEATSAQGARYNVDRDDDNDAVAKSAQYSEDGAVANMGVSSYVGSKCLSEPSLSAKSDDESGTTLKSPLQMKLAPLANSSQTKRNEDMLRCLRSDDGSQPPLKKRRYHANLNDVEIGRSSPTEIDDDELKSHSNTSCERFSGYDRQSCNVSSLLESRNPSPFMAYQTPLQLLPCATSYSKSSGPNTQYSRKNEGGSHPPHGTFTNPAHHPLPEPTHQYSGASTSRSNVDTNQHLVCHPYTPQGFYQSALQSPSHYTPLRSHHVHHQSRFPASQPRASPPPPRTLMTSYPIYQPHPQSDMIYRSSPPSTMSLPVSSPSPLGVGTQNDCATLSSYEKLIRTTGLPKSLSFRKICSRCGKTRSEHGELGFGNKCVLQECGKCGAGIHWHELTKQPMGILCQLTVKQGAIPGAVTAYERRIKELAERADLQRTIQQHSTPKCTAAPLTINLSHCINFENPPDEKTESGQGHEKVLSLKSCSGSQRPTVSPSANDYDANRTNAGKETPNLP